MNRREFLQACVAAGIAATAPHVLAHADSKKVFDDYDVVRMKDVYVDCSAKENGIGTMESPFNDVLEAIAETGFDGNRGVRINIKGST